MLRYQLDKESLQILGNELRDKVLEFRSPSNKFILDLGGNTGKLVVPLKTKHNTVISLDINRDIMTVNNKPLPEIEPIQGDILHLPFKDNTFNFIFARAILHHVPNDLELAFKEIFRVLVPGGMILIEEPSCHNPVAFITRKAFPTTSHEKGEQSLKVSTLKQLTSKYLSILEVKFFWLWSYTIPHIISRLPEKLKPMTRSVLKSLVKLDNILLRYSMFQSMCGYIMIIAQKGENY